MASLRCSAQSIAVYRSSSSQLATPSSSPSELVAVSVRSARANASLEPGAITCATSIAHTRSRRRDGAGSISCSMPSARAVPSTAATCPVRQAAGDLEGLAQLRLRRQPFERARQCIDLVLGPVRQVGQSAVLTLPPSR